MKTRATLLPLCVALVIGTLAGCSTVSRGKQKPSAAVVISVKPGERLSPSDVAAAHSLLEPEIERRGYVMAKSSRSADYYVPVRLPVDPLTLNRLTFVRAEPVVPFLNQSAQEQPLNRGPHREYRREIADMVAEPK